MNTSRKSKIMFERDNFVDFDVIVTEIYPIQTRSIAMKFCTVKDNMIRNNVQQFKGYVLFRYT